MKIKKTKETKSSQKASKEGKIIGAVNATSGAAGIISAHNVCHIACLGLISFLSMFGVVVSGMPLGFLQDYNLLFWSMGAGFLAISLVLYYVMKGSISNRLIIFNAGVVLIGVPFFPNDFAAFWIIGGSLVIISIGGYVLSKFGGSLML
ncbi:MAG: hypothetical protein HZB65_01615 [Candidatus Aenigmarchaeota archaeon]|nr:hypothetical protein [Candidatus Aenigmarchaeota archaeon]